MPLKLSDYSKSTIYKLCCNDTTITDIYVGSTTAFTKRKCGHKTSCNNKTNKSHNIYVYQFIRDNGGWSNWSMVLVEEYNTTTKRNLELRERYWIEKLKAKLNKCIPSRTAQEYYEDKKEYKKEYYQKNIERIRTNYPCVYCGINYTISNLFNHKKSRKCSLAYNLYCFIHS